MIESSSSQSRPQRIRKRRDSRSNYHNGISRYFNRSIPPSAGPSLSSPRDITSARHPVQIHQSPSHQSPSQSPTGQDYLDFFGFQSALADIPPFDQPTHQDHSQEISWFPVSYTFPSLPPNSSLSSEHATFSAQGQPPSHLTSHDLCFASQATAELDNFPSDGDVISMTESHFGSFDSIDSMAPSFPDTVASSFSDGLVCPVTSSPFNSPTMANMIRDLTLPDRYYQTGLADPSYSPVQLGSPQLNDVFAFENDYMTAEWNCVGNIYETEGTHWPPSSPPHPQAMEDIQSAIPTTLSHSPWNVEGLPPHHRADAGSGTFEPTRGAPYETYIAREEYINAREQPAPVFGPEPVSPVVEEESDEWEFIPSSASSSTAVHGSPQSESLTWQQIGLSPQSSPSPNQIGGHPLMFTACPRGSSTAKSTRGRQRPLTVQEKQEALEVRKAKACWACHLSKIKCSPCSLGSPCQQCERLNGKRRFCLLSCFNDPLESLQTFVVPSYLTGHFTQAKVEEFVSQNATSWGTHEMHVRMSWGYWKPLEANVVALTMPSHSLLGYHHQTQTEANQLTLVRKKSPPLGIPLAALDDMREEYRRLVCEIVMRDLHNYVPIAYDDQESELPERLLEAICSFYGAGLAAGQECEILREAIEVHVTATILERSLILDDESMRQVQGYLGEEYPRQSAASCAQRQIKFALFLVQRQRIFDVLKEWGSLMWSSNKNVDSEQKWATSFSVLMMLILLVDKTLEAAFFCCENRIKYHDQEAAAERRLLRELVRLTQTELFERCKEIFHTSFKTRKGGKEACNPIRDGILAFRGRSVKEGISRLVRDLQSATREFGTEIRSQRTSRAAWTEGEYQNAGRLASIFLGDFLE